MVTLGGEFAMAAAFIGATLSAGALVFLGLCWLAGKVVDEHDREDY